MKAHMKMLETQIAQLANPKDKSQGNTSNVSSASTQDVEHLNRIELRSEKAYDGRSRESGGKQGESQVGGEVVEGDLEDEFEPTKSENLKEKSATKESVSLKGRGSMSEEEKKKLARRFEPPPPYPERIVER